MIKAMMCGRRRPGQTLSEHRHHMRNVHGRLVLDYIASDPDSGPKAYTQNHGFDGIFLGSPTVPALAQGFDFVTEIWFEDIASLKSSRETSFYRENLLPDEPRMVDTANVIGLPYAEQIIASPAASAGIKVFALLQQKDIAPEALFAALSASSSAPFGYCRNTALVPGPLVAIDAFWVADEAAAHELVGHYRRIMETQADQPVAFVLAHEHTLYPGTRNAGAH